MLHHFPPSIHNDPFHFSSSSPDRLPKRSLVATRPNPYTAKSQNTQYYTSLRSTAHTNPLDPRLGTATALSESELIHQRSVGSLYNSLEAASRSPRCSSKPQPSPARQYPLLTMVKPKPQPVKALALSAELAAAKRLCCVKSASVGAGKRRRTVVEAAKQQAKSSSSATTVTETSRARPRSQSPILLSSTSPPSRPQRAAPKWDVLRVPRITIRSPTPEPEPSLEPLLPSRGSSGTEPKHSSAPLYSNALLLGLGADLSNAEDGIDGILSKYFNLGKCARPIYVELLRYLTSSICKLYSFVEDPESDLGQAKLRAISSQLFRHTITGFFHLLEDPLAPYGAASNLSLFSAKVVQDFDTATKWCCRVMSGPATSRAQQSLKHGQLFLNVLNKELDNFLERGLAITDKHNKLSLPGSQSPIFQNFSSETGRCSTAECSRPGGSAWKSRAMLRKQWAREGDEGDQFVSINIVRFIGELVLHEVVDVQVVAKWLDRFLVYTVYPDIPSAWEIECACALLITVGAMLERKPGTTESTEPTAASNSSNTDQTEETPSSSSDSDDATILNSGTLQKAMDRIGFLVTQAEISQSAREWLIEVQQLRERGWNRDEDSDSLDGYLDGD